MPEISVVKNLPDVSFIDGATVEDIRGEMVADYEAFMSQTAVAAAVGQYTAWQRAIGRDINPSKLGEMVMAAGAKRVEMAAPAHQIVGAKSVAVLTGQAVQYGGLEDD